MISAHEKAVGLAADPVPVGALIRDLSALLAMGYRRAPLPISADMVRWFEGRSGPETVLELGSVVRRCLLLGDETLVLRELRRHAAGHEEAVTGLSNGSRKSPGSVIDPGHSLNQEAERADPHSPIGRENRSGLQLRMGVRARYRPARRGNS
jgi:hypothetical protein